MTSPPSSAGQKYVSRHLYFLLSFSVHKFGHFHKIIGWWFGTCLIFPCIGNVIIPTDFHMFQRCRSTTNHIHRLSIDYSYIYPYIVHINHLGPVASSGIATTTPHLRDLKFPAIQKIISLDCTWVMMGKHPLVIKHG